MGKSYDKQTDPRTLNFGSFKVGTMCGSRWYWRHSWQSYPLFWSLNKKSKRVGDKGFGIGPILFWDGK